MLFQKREPQAQAPVSDPYFFSSLQQMAAQAADTEPWRRLSVAKGVSICTPEDRCPEDVFNRADRFMYEDKRRMKACG